MSIQPKRFTQVAARLGILANLHHLQLKSAIVLMHSEFLVIASNGPTKHMHSRMSLARYSSNYTIKEIFSCNQ